MSKTETQSEALELAEFFGSMKKSSHRWYDGVPVHEKAAAELRRLDAENKALRIKAARYDYIKQFGTSGETEALTHPRQVVYASIGFHGHELGAAIDARIAEKAAAKNGDAA
ncbi:hypothetical protein [Delftia lacustris]|uniref:hypothetical protein n=1 Tax=Delftia lacustris TaxID=558537 RepID=UPI00064058F0|nr:hypothetical protein [Delftia lacustris]